MADVRKDEVHPIRGVPVSFPFPPYHCQLEYMEKVVQALQEKTNAILESPTGTGKTLSLLCATLAWREQLPPALPQTSWDVEPGAPAPLAGPPKIIYASRTHSQLSQAIHELKSTSYRPKVSIIGSRDQLCINSDVMKREGNTEKVHACRAKVASRSCSYYNNVDVKRLSVPAGFVPDIEELVGLGTKNRMCPYFLARELKAEADLIFMPYNYILDLKTRQTHGINITNTVVILDEAHNIESVCEDSSSFELTSTDIAHCIKDVDYLLKAQYEEAKEYLSELDSQTENTLKDLTNLKELFLCLEKALDNIDLNPDKNECVKPGSYIFDYLGEAGVTMDTYGVLLDQCSQAISSLTSDQALHRSGSYIQKFVDAIKIVFLTSCPPGMRREEMASLHYRIYLKSEANKRKRSNTWTDETSNEDIVRKICYWCFNPGHAMSELIRQGVRSVILTSGTLSPLASFTSELQLDFPVSLQGSHVIGQDQVWVGVVSKGCDNARLNSSYQYRFTCGYMDSLGNTLVNFFRIIPDGILVFFPSYVVMETLVAHWKEGSNIFSRMEQYKQIFKEPRYKTEFNSVMAAFYEKINSPSSTGGAFFGVCRGKVSEGLDFADANGRAVIITGLPYPPRGEPKVQLKMEYLRDAKTSDRRSELITDSEWYSQQATRAVNQAIGRVIRHRNDYGAIILCDERFSYSRSQDELPLWLRPQVQKYEKFGLVQRDLNRFFKFAQSKYGHLASTKKPSSSEVPNVSNYMGGVVGGACGGIKRCPDTLLKDEEFEEMDQIEFPTASLAKIDATCNTGSGCGLLSSLHFSELHPLQPHHVAMVTSRKREVGGRTKFPIPKDTSLVTCTDDDDDSTASSLSSRSKKRIIISNEKNTSCEQPFSVQNFSLQLKECLSKESLSKFKLAIMKYRETENLEVFLDSLQELFCTPATCVLFEGVSHFLKEHHRDIYYSKYLSHTGKPHPLSCPLKTGTKRTRSEEVLLGPVKKKTSTIQ